MNPEDPHHDRNEDAVEIGPSVLPPDPWKVHEHELDLDRLAWAESVFALSNGHLGLRGTLEEGEPDESQVALAAERHPDIVERHLGLVDQRGVVELEPVERVLDEPLRLVVERAGGLVEEQDRRILEQRPRN